jgi:AbiU2
MNETERRQRLRQWLNTIYREVQNTMLDNSIFWEVQEMFKNNSRLADTPSIFNQWMASNFIQAAAVSVRRQADKDSRSVSLYRFLKEIQSFPMLLSRDSVIARYAEKNTSLPTNVCDDHANGDYDRCVGIGKSVPDSDQIQKEIDKLRGLAESIKHYVDKRIAHYDEQGLRQDVPRFSDLEVCFSFFEETIRKYKVLLDAEGITQILPTFSYDWKAIFRFPWLND